MKRRPGLVTTTLPLLLVAICASFFAHAAGGKPTRPDRADVTAPRVTPRQVAEDLYDRGLAARDKGLRYASDAAAADERKSARATRRSEKQFRKAAELFREAVRSDPDMHQAYSSLGFALRRLGEYEPSLRAYDRALQLRPGYVEAIEYRAEAYLALGRLAEVREAYMELFRRDPAQAAVLMLAMRGWLDENPDGGAAGPEERASFATWVSERESLAGQLGEAPAEVRDW